jgi:hypothetical protein
LKKKTHSKPWYFSKNAEMFGTAQHAQKMPTKNPRLILVFIVIGIYNFVEFINFRITLEKKMRYRNIRHNIIISRHLSLSSQSAYKKVF